MRKNSAYARVILNQTVLEKIRRETARYLFKETGGVLVGYVDTQKSLVIVDASGPGPQAQHRFSSVAIDGCAADSFCSEWRAKTGSVVDYFGDWHSHISFSISPSDLDLSAMKIMSQFTPAECYPPISFINPRFGGKYKSFVLQDERLNEIRVEEYLMTSVALRRNAGDWNELAL